MKRQIMYCVALRHLSGIQKGIQGWHAADEYKIAHGETPEHKQWLHNDKTVMLLQANSTDAIKVAMYDLDEAKISYSLFKEPDLGDAITAFCFLLDEEVWDTDTYPNEIPTMAFTNSVGKSEAQMAANANKYGFKTAFLRNFKNQFQLASN